MQYNIETKISEFYYEIVGKYDTDYNTKIYAGMNRAIDEFYFIYC